MDDRWDEAAAAGLDGPLGECVYGSRLLGGDPALVLHGGGNTSVKAPWLDVTGEAVEALYVKGSGSDLASVGPAGFAPLSLQRLRRLLALDALSDAAMMAALAAAKLDAAAPAPSVETLLHALLPHAAVLHSHADVIVALTSLADGPQRVAAALGDDVVVVDYVMPGFTLAKAVARLWPQHEAAAPIGMVLAHHGLVTFGATTRVAYARHVEVVSRAERYLAEHAPPVVTAGAPPARPVAAAELAALRRAISDAAGAPLVVTRHTDPLSRWFAAHPDVARLSRQGPLTPDHVIRTKRVPLLGTDVRGYAAAYEAYFRRHAGRGTGLRMLDPAPRVVVDPRLGVLTAGRSAADAAVAADIYRHTMAVAGRLDALGGYRGLPEADLFDVEYWELEQAKLSRAAAPRELTGQVALVTGAASGIGRACAERLLALGCAVVGVDRDEAVAAPVDDPSWLFVRADVTDAAQLHEAVAAAAARFGGVDVAVLSAGVFGTAAPVAQLDLAAWREVMAVNLDAAAALLGLLHPLLRSAPAGGRVAVIASKNVAAPGPGAAAYSASKAALVQLARVAALEWAGDGIRVNVVHPDAVFDTGLWTPEVLAQRAAQYGLTVAQYKRRNLLGAEVRAADVARVVAALCSDAFRVTTGAQVPVDGGNDRVI